MDRTGDSHVRRDCVCPVFCIARERGQAHLRDDFMQFPTGSFSSEKQSVRRVAMPSRVLVIECEQFVTPARIPEFPRQFPRFEKQGRAVRHFRLDDIAGSCSLGRNNYQEMSEALQLP